MALGLIASSDRARDVAAAFVKFSTHVGQKADISVLVSELLAISASLRELDTAWRNSLHSYPRGIINDDIYTLLRSLEYTIKEVARHCGQLGWSGYPSSRDAYQDVWQKMEDYFYAEGGNSLLRRLEYYREFVDGLRRVVLGVRPSLVPTSIPLLELRQKIEALLQRQDDKLEFDMGNMTLTTSRKPSWERKRPRPDLQNISTTGPGHQMGRGGAFFNEFSVGVGRAYPEEIAGGFVGGGSGGYGAVGGLYGGARPGGASLLSPQSPGYDDYNFPTIPTAPEPPVSPTPTATPSTLSSASSTPNGHWLTTAYSHSLPITSFHSSGSESRCYGQDMPNASLNIDSRYDKLQELSFDNGAVRMRFYLRRLESCLPVTSLRILRAEVSCLQICQSSSRSRIEVQLWTMLRFLNYERLVLFYCSFQALKAQDERNPVHELQDYDLAGERLLFMAVIIDDNYEHALQVLRDDDSPGIRLQASARTGQLERCPVWTAFINYKIASRSWMRRHDAKKVHLADLTRHIFAYNYTPQLGPGGEHELYFKHPNDASEFIRRIEELADGKIP